MDITMLPVVTNIANEVTQNTPTDIDFTPILEKLDIINSNLNTSIEVLFILLGTIIAGFVALTILKGVIKNV